MSRETSPFIVGDWWLDKRRDGKSPHVWQAATYKQGSRQVVYRTTKCRSLEDATAWLFAFVERERSKRPQTVEEAKLVPALFTYWDEHGKKAERPDSIACSLRLFIGFLMQDEAGVDLTVAQADRALFARFIAWRMGPHSWEVPWAGKVISGSSKGVKGETVHSDLARVSAALNRQVDFGRIPMAPKTAKVDSRDRSQPRKYRYTMKQMGAIMMLAAQGTVRDNGNRDEAGIALFRFLLLQLATLVRPEAALKFDPRTQYDPETGLIDLHPAGKARTRKRNPIIPAIPELVPFLEAWAADGAKPVKSRKTAWRHMRRLLDLPPQAEPKTLRRTIASMLHNRFKQKVPKDDIELLLGHRVLSSTTEVYAIYDPTYMIEVRESLSTIFREVAAEALAWGAVHLLSKTGNHASVVLDRSAKKAQISPENGGAACRTRTCDPRITNARRGRKTAVSCEVQPEQGGDA